MEETTRFHVFDIRSIACDAGWNGEEFPELIRFGMWLQGCFAILFFEFLQKCYGGILRICQNLEVSIYGNLCYKKKKKKRNNLKEAEGGSFCLSTHSLLSVFNNIFSMHQGSKIHPIK